MKKTIIVNLIVFSIVLGGIGTIVFFSLPKSQQDDLYNYVTGKYQSQSPRQDNNELTNTRPSNSANTNQVQQQPEPQRQEVRHTCNMCINGRCGDCNGSGSVACDWHDMDRNGDCTKCNNRGQIDCLSCYLKPGVCTVCDGKGYKVTYEYR